MFLRSVILAAASESGLPDPNGAWFIGALVIGLTFLAIAIGAVMVIVKRNPPLHVEFASKQELEALSLRVDGIADEIRESFRELDGKRSRSIAGLHEALENSTQAIREEMKDDVGKLQNRITDVFGEMKRILGRLEK
jgi:hypothetical protein